MLKSVAMDITEISITDCAIYAIQTVETVKLVARIVSNVKLGMT